MSTEYTQHVGQGRGSIPGLQHVARHETVGQCPIGHCEDEPLDLLIGHRSTKHVEHTRYHTLREERLAEEGTAHAQEGYLDPQKQQVLRGTKRAFEARSVFEEVVRVHEPSYGGRAEEARRGDGTPEFEAVHDADGIEGEEALGEFVPEGEAEEGDDADHGDVHARQWEDGFVFRESVGNCRGLCFFFDGAFDLCLARGCFGGALLL